MSDPVVDLLRDEVERRTALAPPAPTPERVRAAARRRGRVAMTATAVAVLVIAGGTAIVVRDVVDQPPPLGVARLSPEHAAELKARAIVNAVVVPPGSQEVAAPPTPILTNIGSRFGTSHVKMRTRFWTAPGTPVAIRNFFRDRTENGQTFDEWAGAVPLFVFFGELQIAVAKVDAHTVGIRADAQVVWHPDRPSTNRVPGGVRSVEVLAYQVSPDNVLARRTLTGPPAQHLADLVNSLKLDISEFHRCLLGTGRSHRLTFTTGHGRVVADLRYCAGLVLTIGGKAQPALQPTQELTRAVDAALGPAASPPR